MEGFGLLHYSHNDAVVKENSIPKVVQYQLSKNYHAQAAGAVPPPNSLGYTFYKQSAYSDPIVDHAAGLLLSLHHAAS